MEGKICPLRGGSIIVMAAPFLQTFNMIMTEIGKLMEVRGPVRDQIHLDRQTPSRITGVIVF